MIECGFGFMIFTRFKQILQLIGFDYICEYDMMLSQSCPIDTVATPELLSIDTFQPVYIAKA